MLFVNKRPIILVMGRHFLCGFHWVKDKASAI